MEGGEDLAVWKGLSGVSERAERATDVLLHSKIEPLYVG